MKTSNKWAGVSIALVMLIAGAYILYNNLKEDYAPDLQVGSSTDENKTYAAPNFTVVDNEGKKVSLSDMKGKPVVVNFWASWCPPCKAEMPDFEKMYKKYGEDIEFMIVNMTDGQQETSEKAKAHIKENDYTFPVYFDTGFSAAAAYSVTALPATYFVDKKGNLVTYARGMINGATLEKGLNMIRD